MNEFVAVLLFFFSFFMFLAEAFDPCYSSLSFFCSSVLAMLSVETVLITCLEIRD